MIAIGNGELDNNNKITKGDKILHQHSDGTFEECTVFFGTNEGGTETDLIGAYNLKNGSTYMASVGGRLLKRNNLFKVTKEN